MNVRSWRPPDADAVYRICLATGDSGQPAAGIVRDPELVPLIFAQPYLLLQPEFVFVAEMGGTVVGYVVAAADTTEFYARWQLEWSPRFAASRPVPREARDADGQLREFLHRPRLMLPGRLPDYPSHLHINLLPQARRRGLGRRLLHAVFTELAKSGSPGVQLGVNPRNTGAHEFYRALGMTRLPGDERVEVRFGLPLNQRLPSVRDNASSA